MCPVPLLTCDDMMLALVTQRKAISSVGSIIFLTIQQLLRLLKSNLWHSISVAFSLPQVLTGMSTFIFHEKLSSLFYSQKPKPNLPEMHTSCRVPPWDGMWRLLVSACEHVASAVRASTWPQEWRMWCITCFLQCIAWEGCTRAEAQVLSTAFILWHPFSIPPPIALHHQSLKLPSPAVGETAVDWPQALYLQACNYF